MIPLDVDIIRTLRVRIIPFFIHIDTNFPHISLISVVRTVAGERCSSAPLVLVSTFGTSGTNVMFSLMHKRGIF